MVALLSHQLPELLSNFFCTGLFTLCVHNFIQWMFYWRKIKTCGSKFTKEKEKNKKKGRNICADLFRPSKHIHWSFRFNRNKLILKFCQFSLVELGEVTLDKKGTTFLNSVDKASGSIFNKLNQTDANSKNNFNVHFENIFCHKKFSCRWKWNEGAKKSENSLGLCQPF